MNYLKNMISDIEIETLSINLDPLAIKKIQKNGHNFIDPRYYKILFNNVVILI